MSPKGIKKCHFLAIFSTFLRKYGRSGCLERLDSVHELGVKSFPQLFLLILSLDRPRACVRAYIFINREISRKKIYKTKKAPEGAVKEKSPAARYSRPFRGYLRHYGA